jgi:hypothetical protein
MRGLFTNESLTVDHGQAVSGIAGGAHILQVISGRVWLTQEGVPHDHWLYAGDTFEVTPGRLVVIEADAGASRIELKPARNASVWNALSTPVAGALRRLARNKSIGNSPQQRPFVTRPGQLKNCT